MARKTETRLLRALNSIRGIRKDGEYTKAGETFETDATTALELIAAGAAEELEAEETSPEPPAATDAEKLAAARADLLAKIAIATAEELEELEIPEDDQELVEAAELRREELTEPDH